jgi:hypothetical protein
LTVTRDERFALRAATFVVTSRGRVPILFVVMTPRRAGRCVTVSLLALIACGRTDIDDVPLAMDAGNSSDASLDAGAAADVGVDGARGVDGGVDGGVCDACGDIAGCCAGDVCIPIDDQTVTACGFSGQCAACPAGGTCFRGACMTTTPDCGPSNCAGCCSDPNTCADGISQRGCGSGGTACVSCFDTSAPTCVPQASGGGFCGGAAVCDPSTCHGCCDGDACLLGNTVDECGLDGDPCVACATGQSCVWFGAGGMCESPPFCAGCSQGCCSGNVCAPGTADDACGVGGGACESCVIFGQICREDGQCVDGCNASNCSGCCQGDICAVGDQSIACGFGGLACVDCAAFHGACVDNNCALSRLEPN